MSYKGDPSQLYGVKGKALEAALNANRTILSSPTMPAIERYSGVVYNGIHYPTLATQAKEFFQAHVRIVSALFGLVKSDELIPDYKLKIEKLDAAFYWKPIINKLLSGYFVIDLLPQTHQKAVGYKEGVKVDFLVFKKDKPVPVGHQGKLIKGRFIRWLCEQGVTDPARLSGFQEDGFKFDGKNFIKRG